MEQKYWENRYETQTTGWDIKEVSTPLKNYFDQLTNKKIKILIPGCGFGHEVIYLYKNGFSQITALDFVSESLRNIQENFPDIQTIRTDFFLLQEKYDLIIEQTLFCAIDPNRRIEYIKKCLDLLNDGGKYVGLLFNREFEGGPPFGGSLEEYKDLFKDKFSSLHLEPCYNSISARNGTELFIIAKK